MDPISKKQSQDTTLKDWHQKEKLALDLIWTAGELRFTRGVELIMFWRDVYDARPSAIINHHLFANNYVAEPIKVSDTVRLARAILELDEIVPAKIDIGHLATKWQMSRDTFPDPAAFVRVELGDFIGTGNGRIEPKDVVLYGFGRIGRLIARRIISTTGRGDQLRLRAIVLRAKMKDIGQELKKRTALLQDDSIHGPFPGTVEINEQEQTLTINGNKVHVIFADEPELVDYMEYGIHDALLIDNTGVWRDRKGLSRHLRPGIGRVLLTAPGKDVPNLVHGVNQAAYDAESDSILSAASCTTNAIVPVIRVVDDNFGIVKGHIETIHAYTSDQNLLDNFHKKPRRGRGAAINMVLTTTGAAKAVAKVMPHLSGKLTGNAVRVPTPDVSLAIMNLHFDHPVTVEMVNSALKEASIEGDLVEQIHYSNSTEYVSSHAVGMTTTSVLDAPSTIVSEDGRSATIYAWYDNEYGYCCQVVRLAKHISHVRRKTYY